MRGCGLDSLPDFRQVGLVYANDNDILILLSQNFLVCWSDVANSLSTFGPDERSLFICPSTLA